MEQTWKGNIARRQKSELKAREPLRAVEQNGEAVQSDNTTLSSPLEARGNHSVLTDYVLPDGFRITRGFSRPHDPSNHKRQHKTAAAPSSTSTIDDETSMTLGCERFSIPEVLFTPSDIGSRQPGIPAAAMQSISVLPPALQATLLSNILVVGGNARMQGFVQRIQGNEGPSHEYLVGRSEDGGK